MREMIWNAVRSKLTEGMILPWWALTVRAVLYPLEFFYWRMSQQTGYQCLNDTWLINGVTYSNEALRWMAQAQGETYRVTRTGNTVTLERVHNECDGCETEQLRYEVEKLKSLVAAYEKLAEIQGRFKERSDRLGFSGCSVCGIGSDGNAMGYGCSRNDCPSANRCGDFK
jgi:hypothetical protein